MDREEELPPPEPLRELTDPRAMRALTHPVRLALLEALGMEGPLTATAAAEVIGESPTTCSFHLRQLAKYGFVEEAGRGPGRTRPWRLTHSGMRFSDVHDDPVTATAAVALDRLLRERYFERLQQFYATRSSLPAAWREVTGGSEYVLYVTPEELREVDQELNEILLRYRDRFTDAALRPEGAAPIEVLLFAYPVRPPQTEGGS
jgi:predicted ArsR family transcriptional regulator